MREPIQEEWRVIPDFPHIEVSNMGRARSKTRVVERSSAQQTIHGQALKGSTHASGHISISLSKTGRKKRDYLHRLIYEQFVGGIPEGMEVRHWNGNPADNRLENLLIGTRSEQRYDDVRNGVHRYAAKKFCKRGHRLEAPFLIERILREKGHRNCKPCNWATMRKTRMGWDGETIQRMSDFYAKRLGEVGEWWTPSMG